MDCRARFASTGSSPRCVSGLTVLRPRIATLFTFIGHATPGTDLCHPSIKSASQVSNAEAARPLTPPSGSKFRPVTNNPERSHLLKFFFGPKKPGKARYCSALVTLDSTVSAREAAISSDWKYARYSRAIVAAYLQRCPLCVGIAESKPIPTVRTGMGRIDRGACPAGRSPRTGDWRGAPPGEYETLPSCCLSSRTTGTHRSADLYVARVSLVSDDLGQVSKITDHSGIARD